MSSRRSFATHEILDADYYRSGADELALTCGGCRMAVSAIQNVRTRGSAKPTVAELIKRARTIGLIAREKAHETEQQRYVSAGLIGMMRDAELFRLMQPERFGGF